MSRSLCLSAAFILAGIAIDFAIHRRTHAAFLAAALALVAVALLPEQRR